MNKLWRSNAGCLVIVCLLLNLSVGIALIQFTVSQDSANSEDPGSIEETAYPEEEWFEETELPPELVIAIPKDVDPNRSDMTFEEAKASWNRFLDDSYEPDLNLNPTKVKYYSNISGVFDLNQTQWEYISKNGFVVADNERFWQKTSFEDLYHMYWRYDLPVLITTDSMLNTFHLLFDQFLQEAENETFRPLLSELTSELLLNSAQVHNQLSDSILKESMKDIVIFFGVASKLLETGDHIPDYAVVQVDAYVKKILDAKEVELFPGQDYTQYKPRGHYAGKPFLEKYFRAMMWYGRKSLDMKINENVLQACLMSMVILASEEAQRKWVKIYEVTSYLVGKSDSLNFFDILKAMYISLGDWDLSKLTHPESVERVKEELKKDYYYRQKILSDVMLASGSSPNEPTEIPKVFQFMGQRYIPDSEVMQSVMYDRVPMYNYSRRGLPSGLDVMAALGSSRAVHNLESELEKYNYTEQLRNAWASVETKSEGYWEQSAYFGLLRSYKELISGEENDTYPDFMRTEAWADEKLNTVLGSWAELRHDTILYAKQPYSFITCGTPDALVEPYPTFYARMEKLSIMMRDIIVNNFDLDNPYAVRFAEVFEEFAQINFNLTTIAEHELEGEDLSSEERRFARGVYTNRDARGGCGPMRPDGWLPLLIKKADIEEDTKDSRIIADVATDPQTKSILHVGTGYVRSVIVSYQMPDGSHSFFVGPVCSFYEFPVGGFNRLNDDQWKELLDSNDCPPDPFWTSTFMA